MSLPTAPTQMSLQDFLVMRDFVYKRTGIFFHESKQYFLENRLTRLVAEKGLKSYQEYLALVQGPQGRDEMIQLINEITTNETSFWRNPPQIEAFQNIVLPDAVAMAQERKQNRLRIWSAACSSGEEPYTLAMVCLESQAVLKGLSVEIIATDISDRVLTQAKDGVYGAYALRNLTPAQLQRHFTQRSADTYAVRDESRKMVTFKHFNLVDYPEYRSLGVFDVIFCRNVLIYFDDAVKRKVLQGFHDQLGPKCHLLVGHSESIHAFNNGFEIMHFCKAMGYRKRT